MTESEKYELQKQSQIDFVNERLSALKEYMEDDDITEIMLNPDGYVWVESYEKGMYKTSTYLNEMEGYKIIQVLASYNSKIISEKNPRLSGNLPNSDRFQGAAKGITKGIPIFTIRKRPKKIFTLDDYLAMGSITEFQKNFLTEAILNKKNIVVSGGTGTGKTTFTNALVDYLKQVDRIRNTVERIYIIEEVEEIICDKENVLRVFVTEDVSALELSKDALRHRPDRIIQGELRYGEEAEEILKNWNTGHSGGFTTVHSDGAEETLERLEELLMEVDRNPRQPLIGRSVDVIVNIIRITENGKTVRKVNKIIKVNGFNKKTKEYEIEEVGYEAEGL